MHPFSQCFKNSFFLFQEDPRKILSFLFYYKKSWFCQKLWQIKINCSVFIFSLNDITANCLDFFGNWIKKMHNCVNRPLSSKFRGQNFCVKDRRIKQSSLSLVIRRIKFIQTELGNFVLDTDIPNCFILISTFNFRIYNTLLFLIFIAVNRPPWSKVPLILGLISEWDPSKD